MRIKSTYYFWIFTFIALITFTACTKKKQKEVENAGVYTDYYPLKIGSYHTYLIDSIYHNDFTMTADTFQFQLKEMVTDTFYDQSKQLNYRLERYYKFKTSPAESFNSIAWVFKNVWFITLTNISVQRVEENIRYVNLTNPVKNGISWDGNVFNTKEKYNYTYQEFGENLQGYDDAVRVIQHDNSNNIEKQYYEQCFAKGVGLIKYHYIDVLSNKDPDVSIPIMDRIQKGVEYNQELIDHYIPK